MFGTHGRRCGRCRTRRSPRRRRHPAVISRNITVGGAAVDALLPDAVQTDVAIDDADMGPRRIDVVGVESEFALDRGRIEDTARVGGCDVPRRKTLGQSSSTMQSGRRTVPVSWLRLPQRPSVRSRLPRPLAASTPSLSGSSSSARRRGRNRANKPGNQASRTTTTPRMSVPEASASVSPREPGRSRRHRHRTELTRLR